MHAPPPGSDNGDQSYDGNAFARETNGRAEQKIYTAGGSELPYFGMYYCFAEKAVTAAKLTAHSNGELNPDGAWVCSSIKADALAKPTKRNLVYGAVP